MKITQPGLYDIPMETYHGDCCDGPSVSGSGLVKIEGQSLAHYWHDSYLNPKRPQFDTAALSFGRAAHAMILGEPEWNKYFVISPYPDFRTKEARSWKESETRTIVKPDQYETIKAMSRVIASSPLLSKIFKDGKPEQSLIWKDKETGIWLKSRPDWLPNSIQFVPNFKTSRSARPADFQRQAYELGYHQGAALCLEGIREIIGWNSPTYYFVVQEKEPPYVATLALMRDTDIEWGALLNRSALRKLARALDKGEWPGYATSPIEIQMPAWAEKNLLDRHEQGEFQTTQERANT